MAMHTTTRTYLIGVLTGLGIGLFAALALAEDGDLAPGIRPGTVGWKAVKFGGLVLVAVGAVWRVWSGSGRGPVAEPDAAADGGA
ncbi:MAG: hypothetical protein EBR86_11575 [Planctomycetia bacterium]|nr:hypothetical protein [Planctomycetia bacterium]